MLVFMRVSSLHRDIGGLLVAFIAIEDENFCSLAYRA
jgi:hypothetical protein